MTTAFIFPGQGSQAVGMGRDLYDQSPAVRAIFDSADAALDMPLTRLCFEGPREELTATEHAQPALLATSVALLTALAGDARDLVAFVAQHAAFVAGHSLGEYSALVAAGALDLPTALRLVRQRGELMAAAHAGSMAAVMGMDEGPLEEICREVSADGARCVIANYNSPGQFVISGRRVAVERAEVLAKERGAKRVQPLKVSAAFHSPLMRDAAVGLAPAIIEARIVDACVPVMGNVSAESLLSAKAIRQELIVQVTAPVRWITSVQHMVAAGVDTFVEIGPGSVLTRLIKRIAPEARLINVSDAESVRAFLGGKPDSMSQELGANG